LQHYNSTHYNIIAHFRDDLPNESHFTGAKTWFKPNLTVTKLHSENLNKRFKKYVHKQMNE